METGRQEIGKTLEENPALIAEKFGVELSPEVNFLLSQDVIDSMIEYCSAVTPKFP